jgi:DNA modification methylase
MRLKFVVSEQAEQISQVINHQSPHAILIGDCRTVLKQFPSECIDCVITSPPYWKMREYDMEGVHAESPIGNEDAPADFVKHLSCAFAEVMRVLKPTGSLWLNIGDKYHNKNLMGMPWRVALALQDQGWILRNDIIWEKMKGTQSAKDRLRTVYEHIFHFVKSPKYFFDSDKILVKPRLLPTFENGKTISATGVSGKKYREQILNSEYLNEAERKAALEALEGVLEKIRGGEIVDFRMTIRGQQRTLHSDKHKVSGRAKELERHGFFMLTSRAKGYIPSDIWRIAPEDEIRGMDDTHYAVFPIELLQIPIKATCPPDGIILDPFMGTGSTLVAATRLQKRCIGIDVSKKYIEIARKRLSSAQIEMLA